MAGKTELLEEMIENTSAIPLECQERILDVVKAMVFTRRVVEKEYGKQGSLTDRNPADVNLRQENMQ